MNLPTPSRIMLSIFHIFALAGLVFGASFGAWEGAGRSGAVGLVIGAVAGGLIGLVLGRIPGWLMLRSVAHDLGSKSSDELRGYLRSPGCLTPNCVLLELQRRAEDTRPEIPVILDLLVSTDIRRRSRGWAALNSAFPELAGEISNYCAEDPLEECQRKTEPLRLPAVRNLGAVSTFP